MLASAVGFWMMGNRQLFGHDANTIETKNDVVLSNHTLDSEAMIMVSGKLSLLENVYLIAFVLTAFFYTIYLLVHVYEVIF